MKKLWSFVMNVFVSVTNGNYLRMLKISTWHYNALKAKAGLPFFDPLIAFYEPLHLAYVSEYNKWLTSKGIHVGGTASLEDLLELLSGTKIEEWDIKIQAVYRRDSPQYLALLPNYRGPFQTGSREGRISAVESLATAIGTDASLATVKADAIAFHLLLVNARSAQQGDLSETDDFSEDVEVARKAAGEGQYKNLGLLMGNFYQTPAGIEPFFDLENIRKIPQVEFAGTPKANTTSNIFKRTLQPGDNIRIINDGDVPLTFGIVAEKNDAVTAPSITVQPGEEEIVPASSLGSVPGSKYLNVRNDDVAVDGHFIVELI